MESTNKMELTYTNVNGYLIPNLTYKSGEQMEQLGKYGFLRRDYLKNHRNSTYQVMLVVALNDYFSREYRNEADPYLETREKEDAFLERVETAVRDGVKESAPMAIAKNLMEMLVPFVKESVGEINLLDRTLTMEKTDGEIAEDNLDWEKEADMDAALDFVDSF